MKFDLFRMPFLLLIVLLLLLPLKVVEIDQPLTLHHQNMFVKSETKLNGENICSQLWSISYLLFLSHLCDTFTIVLQSSGLTITRQMLYSNVSQFIDEYDNCCFYLFLYLRLNIWTECNYIYVLFLIMHW